MVNVALLSSGIIPVGQVGLAFNGLITFEWQTYELKLNGIFPASPLPGAERFVFLFMHLSKDNGVTWDSNSCHDAAGSIIPGCSGANYSFSNMFTIPGGGSVLTRNPGQGALDEEFEIAQPGIHRSGVCGSIRLFTPLAQGIYKQVQWDTSYFGPDNFCRESGAGVWFGNRDKNGSLYNAFRILFANPGANPVPQPFGGGHYSLWAYQ
jgi:hypothetical protein